MKKIVSLIKKYGFIFVMILFALVSLNLFVSELEEENLHFDNYIDQYIQSINALTSVSIQNKLNVTSVFYDGIIDEETKAILLETEGADKDRLKDLRHKLYYKHFDFYERVQRVGVRQFQFHLTNSESFLRFHSPDAYGDSLLEVRQTVNDALTSKSLIHGIEEGRAKNGYRYVYPILDKDNLVGSVELSYSFKSIIEPVIRTNNLRAVYVIDKAEVERKTHLTITNNYITDMRYPTGYVDSDFPVDKIEDDLWMTIDQFKDLNNQVIDHMKNDRYMKDGFTFLVGDGQLVWALPIKVLDYNNKKIGDLIYYKNDLVLYQIYSHNKDHRVFLTTSFVISILMISLSIYLYLKLQRKAEHDLLTDMYNRNYFYEHLSARIKTGAIMMIDIDDFKEINDNYGHDVGDKVLSKISELIKSKLRSTDYALRWGGEEFLVILRNTTPVDAYQKALNLVRDVANESFENHQVTISIGVSEANHNFNQAIKEADLALYEVKNSGKNNVRVYDKGSTL